MNRRYRDAYSRPAPWAYWLVIPTVTLLVLVGMGLFVCAVAIAVKVSRALGWL